MKISRRRLGGFSLLGLLGGTRANASSVAALRTPDWQEGLEFILHDQWSELNAKRIEITVAGSVDRQSILSFLEARGVTIKPVYRDNLNHFSNAPQQDYPHPHHRGVFLFIEDHLITGHMDRVFWPWKMVPDVPGPKRFAWLAPDNFFSSK